jgi:putative hemolysin
MTRTKDLLAEYVKGKPASIKTSAQQPPLVLERMDALDVVDRLRKAMAPLALVVDEYGSIAGMVTLTDILEALIGDMPGLDVDNEPEATQREDGSWLVDGMMSVEELQPLLDIDELPAEDANYETVSGLFMAHLGRIPLVGDKFEWRQFHFEVMDMDRHRVDKAMIMPVMPQSKISSR